MSDAIHSVGVVGAGQMGNGIAHVAALAGYDVTLTDISAAALERALGAVQKNLGRMIKKEKITEDEARKAVARIRMGTELGIHENSQLVIEAATENVDLKYRIFEQLGQATSADTLLATNTSSISITAIAAHTDRPDKVVGMHFMNPVPVMKLVELIRGLATSDETFAAVEAAAQKMGKTTVEARDMPGFIVNRVLMPYINEAAYAISN